MTGSPSDTPDPADDTVAAEEASVEVSPSAEGGEPAAAATEDLPETDDARESDAEGDEAETAVEELSETAQLASRIAEMIGASSWSADHGTVKIALDASEWKTAIETLHGSGEFPFFSWLSAIDWSADPTVGEAVADPDSLEERFELLCRVSSLSDNSAVTLSTSLSKEAPAVDSVWDVYGGAEWHERECHEMFGVDFTGHPNLAKLYLPDAFEGHPLRKDYPLLSREVKPWPGTVDVEGMPTTENAEADAIATDGGDA